MSGSAAKSVAKSFLARQPALASLLGTDSIFHGFPSQVGLLRANASSWTASRPVTRCFSNVALWPDVTFHPLKIVPDDLHVFTLRSKYGPSAFTNTFGPTRFKSNAAAQEAEPSEEASPGDKVKDAMQKAKESGLTVSNYWGIAPKSFSREDGSPWPWNSFRPWDAYSADVSIDLSRHHKTDTLVDKIAYHTVKILRWPTDLFFQKRYGCRAMMLETVAAVPGMVAGMLLHLKSLRRFEHSGGWIKALLEEAENERMHLMTFMEVAKPKWYERALVFAVQGIFFNAYFVLYLVSPRLAHRITGYLEEEAIYSYTEYLKEIDKGHLPNIPAPAIAIDYWRLPKDATIKDVVMVVRADEAHHRDVNHFAADLHSEGKELRDAPAPVGYH